MLKRLFKFGDLSLEPLGSDPKALWVSLHRSWDIEHRIKRDQEAHVT